MSKKLKVSVCMITYGHEKFIEEAINGVLMQEVDFDIELIVSNDASPDRTDEIVKKIIQNHPRSSWIRYIRHESNIGMMLNSKYVLEASEGEFIASCEGDDYWTDPYKLQKQVDFLENNLDYVICFHKVDILKTNGQIVEDFITKVPENHETIETLAQFGNYIHTPSVIFRNVIDKYPFEIKLTPIGDYFLYIILAEFGKIKYMNDNMAIYRYNVGVISQMSSLDIINNEVAMYSCMLGCIHNEEVKKILLDKQKNIVTQHYKMLEKTLAKEYEAKELEYKKAFISRHFIFIKIKMFFIYYNNPRLFLNKVKNKLSKHK